VCPRQPALESVTRRSLLVVLGVVADLEGGCPRDTGKLENPSVTASDISQQCRARVFPGLLDLRGGSSSRALRGVALLVGWLGTGTFSAAAEAGWGDDGPSPSTTPVTAPTTEGVGVAKTASVGWGRGASMLSPVNVGGARSADSLRTPSVASGVAEGAEPPASLS
jgi:hypothetical protein